MYLMLVIGIPVIFVFGGALLALAFTMPREDEDVRAADAPAEQVAVPAVAPAFFFAPAGALDAGREIVGPSGAGRDAIEERIRALELHLRRENAAVRAFALDPSVESLWADQPYVQ